MTIRVEVSSREKVRRFCKVNYSRRRKESGIVEFAFGFAVLRFGAIRIDRIDIASFQAQDAAIWSGITRDQIRHAVFIEVSGGEPAGPRKTSLEELLNLDGLAGGRRQLDAIM
jgi:hypothetical protein